MPFFGEPVEPDPDHTGVGTRLAEHRSPLTSPRRRDPQMERIDVPQPTKQPPRFSRGLSIRQGRGGLKLTIALSALATALPTDASELEEVSVTASLLDTGTEALSVSIINEPLLAQRGASHLENLLNAIPNFTGSAGASRNRFFQIRGVGERSQFVEPINPSIGILMDGIDISGLGGALTLFDVERVEVLRGPQGTLMGANALAGMINLQSGEPGSPVAELTAGLEQFDGLRLATRVGGELSPSLAARFAVQHYQSDGFVDNVWLGRNDTNRREELTSRGTMRWQGEDHSLEAALYYSRIDNGYDAFSLDNTRKTLSDEPGEDDLSLRAARVRWQGVLHALPSSLQLSHADTRTTYSYDEDWSFVGIAPGWEYQSVDQYRRHREMNSLEWRLQAPDDGDLNWVLGVYLREEAESLVRQYTYLTSPFDSRNDTQTGALFAEISRDFGPDLRGFAGLRWERREAEYRDNNGVDHSFDSDYWTGRTGLIWQFHPDHQGYITVARGARAGGANAGLLASISAVPEEAQSALTALGTFGEETLLSVELGWDWFSPSQDLRSRLSLFHMSRDNQQAKGSMVIPRSDGSTAFIDYTDNAAAGRHQGLEWEAEWQTNSLLTWTAALGWLDARFDHYLSAAGVNLSDRDQPQSPHWQYSLAAVLQWPGNLTARLELTGLDDYYFSDRHDVSSAESHIVNASLSGADDRWRWTLWARNLTDETTFTRGFGTFGNDPRKQYQVEPYRQFGEPRIVGVTLTYQFLEAIR